MSEIIKYEEAKQIGEAMVASGYFKDAQKASQAIVKVLAGAEMGIGPFAAMTGIHIIKGKPVLGANVLATLIKNDARYNYKVVKHSEVECSIDFFENGEKIGNSTVRIEELRKAGSQNLDKYPKNMLFARAISNGAKWHTPGIFGGSPVYTPDEFDLEVDEDGDVLEAVAVAEVVTPEPVEKPAQASKPAPKKEAPVPQETESEAVALYYEVFPNGKQFEKFVEVAGSIDLAIAKLSDMKEAKAAKNK